MQLISATHWRKRYIYPISSINVWTAFENQAQDFYASPKVQALSCLRRPKPEFWHKQSYQQTGTLLVCFIIILKKQLLQWTVQNFTRHSTLVIKGLKMELLIFRSQQKTFCSLLTRKKSENRIKNRKQQKNRKQIKAHQSISEKPIAKYKSTHIKNRPEHTPNSHRRDLMSSEVKKMRFSRWLKSRQRSGRRNEAHSIRRTPNFPFAVSSILEQNFTRFSQSAIRKKYNLKPNPHMQKTHVN